MEFKQGIHGSINIQRAPAHPKGQKEQISEDISLKTYQVIAEAIMNDSDARKRYPLEFQVAEALKERGYIIAEPVKGSRIYGVYPNALGILIPAEKQPWYHASDNGSSLISRLFSSGSHKRASFLGRVYFQSDVFDAEKDSSWFFEAFGKKYALGVQKDLQEIANSISPDIRVQSDVFYPDPDKEARSDEFDYELANRLGSVLRSFNPF